MPISYKGGFQPFQCHSQTHTSHPLPPHMPSTACSKSSGFLLQVMVGPPILSNLVTDIPHRHAQLILDAIELTIKINYHTSNPLYCCICILSRPLSPLSPAQSQYLRPPPFHKYSAFPNLGMFNVSIPLIAVPLLVISMTCSSVSLLSSQGSHLPYAMLVTHPSRSCSVQGLISSFVFFSSLKCTVQSQDFYLVCRYAFPPGPIPLPTE